MKTTIVTTDVDGNRFIFLDVTEKAKEIFSSGIFEIFEIDGNDEYLIETHDHLNHALSMGLPIGIQVGSMGTLIKQLANTY